MKLQFILIGLAAALAGCASGGSSSDDMAAVAPSPGFNASSGAQDASPASELENANYRISALDLINVSVFRVPDLSVEKLRVDASGSIELPLIGSLPAAGMTPAELAQDIRDRLAVRYLQNPQVSVTVAEASSQKVTVDGAVTEPGVYEMTGRTTLLQAVAMAKGATRVANLRNIAVFRTVDGQRMAAIFDLAAIRDGDAVDPVLRGDDIVVVETSRTSAFMRDLISALPGLAVFSPY